MDQQFIGQTFRQISTELRWRRDGRRIHSVRPQNPKTEAYLDLDAPTLITFEAGDSIINPASLIMCRCIAPYTPPKIKPEPRPPVAVAEEDA